MMAEIEIKTTKELKRWAETRKKELLEVHKKATKPELRYRIEGALTELCECVIPAINGLEASVKDEAISIHEAFEIVWKECPEFKVSLYNALTRQKELLFKILGIKYQPARSVEELRSILEGWVDAETAEAEEMNCKNCGRSGKITRILLHHIVPRELYGGDEQDNRLPLCSACERFIHFRYSNRVLTELKEKILQEKDVQLFGVFVNSPEYIRRSDVQDIENDFEKWKSNIKGG